MVRYTKDFAGRRRVTDDAKQMNRLYVVESSPTVTGGKAEHRLPIRRRDIEGFASALAAAVGARRSAGDRRSERTASWVAAVAKDLQRTSGRSVVIAGECSRPAVHALAHAMNEALGNVGTTVTYGAIDRAAPIDGAASIAELVAGMEAGRVELLLVSSATTRSSRRRPTSSSANASRRSDFACTSACTTTRRQSSATGTSRRAHSLESWGDARAFDGTVTLMQPLIAPLYDAHSAHEVLTTLTSQPTRRRSTSSRTIGRARSAARQDGPSETPMAKRSETPTRSGSRPCTTVSCAGRRRRPEARRRRSSRLQPLRYLRRLLRARFRRCRLRLRRRQLRLRRP